MNGVGEPELLDTVDAQTAAYTIGYSEDLDAVVSEWHGSPDPALHREGMEALLDEVEARGVRKLLSDASSTVPLSDSLVAWVAEEWVPRLAGTTVRYNAVVYPADATAAFFADQIGRAHTGLDVEHIFAEDRATARAWLAMR